MLNRNYTRKIVPSYFFQRIDFVRFFATSLNLFHTLELFGKLRAGPLIILIEVRYWKMGVPGLLGWTFFFDCCPIFGWMAYLTLKIPP